MYVREDVFSHAIWPNGIGILHDATPTIPKTGAVQVVSSMYIEDGETWVGIHYRNRRYEIPMRCLLPVLPGPPSTEIPIEEETAEAFVGVMNIERKDCE